MIMIIDVCSDPLSKLEFVRPVKNLLRDYTPELLTRNYLEISSDELSAAEKIVICGTALKDLNYLKNINKFAWLKRYRKPVLGICAGFQILGRVFGNELVEKGMIGQFRVNVIQNSNLTPRSSFTSYFLSSETLGTTKHFDVLAESGEVKCMVKHLSNDFYGCLFHPEVLNPEIIASFCRHGNNNHMSEFSKNKRTKES